MKICEISKKTLDHVLFEVDIEGDTIMNDPQGMMRIMTGKLKGEQMQINWCLPTRPNQELESARVTLERQLPQLIGKYAARMRGGTFNRLDGKGNVTYEIVKVKYTPYVARDGKHQKLYVALGRFQASYDVEILIPHTCPSQTT